MHQIRFLANKLVLLATVVSVYLFFYIPIIILVVFSFNSAPFPSPWVGFTWRWYHELYVSSYLWQALATSLTVALTATALSIIMSVALIYYSMHNPLRTKRVNHVFSLFYGNIVIPEVVLAVGLLSFFMVWAVPLGLVTLIVAHTVLGLGYAVPLLYARYSELDYRLVEASLDLGATVSQTFFKIILPLLRPAIVAAALLISVISFDDFVLSYFCAGSSSQTLSLYILSMLRSGVSPVINALSTLLLVLSSLLVLLFCSVSRRSRIF